MRLDSSLPPHFLPDGDQDNVLRLGLSPLPIAEWLRPDADFAAFHQHKLESLDTHAARVVACTPDSTALQTRFADFLLAHLLRVHADLYAVVGENLVHRPTGLRWPLAERSLADCSRWIQEDICLLEPDAGHYRLAAACVCAPSNWRLEDKIGKTLDAIHAPVPGYQKQLASRVDRLLDGLKPAKSVSRINWSIQPGNELLWRDEMSDGNHSEPKYWRIERQCLLRMPGTDGIIFSIRIYLHNLENLLKIPGIEANLQQILSRLPADQLAYKGLTTLRL